MTYTELIAKVLKGRSVNSVALEMGVPQKSLDRYVKAESMPSVSVAIKMAERAGVSVEEAARAIAEQENMVRPKRQLSFPRLAATAAGLVIAVTNFVTPGNAEAAPRLPYSQVAGDPLVLM
ncbi:MAG TPA: helix-turn-helix transcriptional regulator [Noviherbaspirillum sp.]|jgi:transcriptional regulator with XRE-family HTH domain|uniref:helix-turn-helix domain-containing protein n=1 Tax=Noviherbaspirillum sp. TaxID=1926288 RepID=UPI002F92EDEC